MSTTDVMLVITIMLLLSMTAMNIHRSRLIDQVNENPCDGFSGPFSAIENRETFIGGYDQIDPLEEMTNHPKSRGTVPQSTQPQHTANLWKSSYSQAEADDSGMRNTSFSSDLLTPYRNEYKLRSANPESIEVRAPHAGDTIWEPSQDNTIEACCNRY